MGALSGFPPSRMNHPASIKRIETLFVDLNGSARRVYESPRLY